MKKTFALHILLVLLALSATALAHHEKMGDWNSLPKYLELSPSQRANYDAYLKEMHADLMKIHEKAVEQTRKFLTQSQYAQFTRDMKEMHGRHKMMRMKRGGMMHSKSRQSMMHPMMMSDQAMKAMVDKEADKLLLTEGQAVQFENTAEAMGRNMRARIQKFFTQIKGILTKRQRDKLAKCGMGEQPLWIRKPH